MESRSSDFIARAKGIAIVIGAVSAAIVSIYQGLKAEEKAKAGYEVLSSKIPESDLTINGMIEVINNQNKTIRELEQKVDSFQCKCDEEYKFNMSSSLKIEERIEPLPVSSAPVVELPMKSGDPLPSFSDL